MCRCVHHGWHGTHRYDIKELEYRIDVCRVTSGEHIDTSLFVKKKTFFGFPVAVKNSIKVGPLVFLL